MEVGTVTPTRQTPVHDPVLIRQDSTYYLFCTGFGITVFSSKDMTSWRREKPVLWTVMLVSLCFSENEEGGGRRFSG